MNDETILITGANGQLGQALRARYPKAQTVDVSQLDIADSDAVNSYNWDGIKIIINPAAFTNVDGAETQEGRVKAWSVNAAGVSNLVKASLDHDLCLVQLSTDYVFDGTKVPHKEDELFSPLGVYGQTKAAGDIAASMMPKHYVLRTSWVIGEGKNFVRTMLGVGQSGTSPTVVADQTGRLAFTSELVRAIDHLLSTKQPFGTYNVSNSGEVVSWAEITRSIFKEAGFNLEVNDTTTEEYYRDKENIAPRPLQSELDLSKLQATGFVSIDWREDLSQYVKQEMTKT